MTSRTENSRSLRLLGPRSRQIALVAGLGSLALLVSAYIFEFAGGLAPCPLCLWQRWPHGIAAALGIAALAAPVRPVALLGSLAMLIGAGIGGYHTGVEYGWWVGPSTCTAPDITGLSPEELFEQIMAAPVVRCDEVAWSFLGLSMAAWNTICSLALAGLWTLSYASSSASQYR